MIVSVATDKSFAMLYGRSKWAKTKPDVEKGVLWRACVNKWPVETLTCPHPASALYG
jgi:hypothetical protein